MKDSSKLQFRETIDLLIEAVYLAVIFIIPLYFSVIFPTYNIFELSKLSLFKIFVWLLLFLTLTKFVFVKSPIRWLKKYIFIPAIFIVGLGLTLPPSINITQSFFGSYDRQAGYLGFLFYFLWFVLLTFNIWSVDNRIFRSNGKDNSENKIKRIIVVAVFSGFLVAIYGILQILGIDFLSWPENPLLTKRTISTFGQPNFLASWLLLVIPLSAYLIYENRKFFSRFIYSFILLIQLACLFSTSSRGGLIALGLSILLFIFYLLFFVRLKPAYKLGASFGLLLVLISSLWSLNYFLPGRLNSLLALRGGSITARVNFYQAAANAIVKKPFFGYGLENGGEVFIKYYEPDWGVYGDVSATTDKAHNLVLDIVLASGLAGLILFTIFYYYYFRLAKENIKQHKMANLSLALSFGAAAYLFSLLFSFTIVAGEIYFWSFLALLAVINMIGEEPSLSAARIKSSLIARRIIKILAILMIFISVSWGIRLEFRNLMADYYFDKFYYALGQGQYLTAFVLAEYAAQEKTNPINQEYYDRFLGDKLSDFYPDLKELPVKKISQTQLEDLNKKIPDLGYENIYVKAKINSILGNYSQAEKYFKEILTLTPYWPKTYIDFGRSLVREGRFSEAIISYQLAVSNLPDLNDVRLNDSHRKVVNLYRKIIFTELGDIYFYLKNYPEAEKDYQSAYIADVRDFTLFKKIADTYYRRGNFKKALEYNERGANRNPSDFNWFLSISALYKEIGDKQASLNYFNQALKLAPTEKLLLDLKSSY